MGRCPGRSGDLDLGGARGEGGVLGAAGQTGDKRGDCQVGSGGGASPALGLVLKVRVT